MRVVVQRVARANVTVAGKTVAAIAHGMLALVGVASGDDEATARRLATKCAELRIFPGGTGHFDRSLVDAGGEALVVPQFTLLADVRRGRRPSFAAAAPPETARPLVDAFAQALRGRGVRVQTGLFGAMMQVELVNDGPVTIIASSEDLGRPRRR